MARKSKGDEKLEKIIEDIHKKIEHYEATAAQSQAEVDAGKEMISILREQLKSIEEMCMGV